MGINEVLLVAWSKESSTKWTIENSAKGQCGVTALVINDLYGGAIKKSYQTSGIFIIP